MNGGLPFPPPEEPPRRPARPARPERDVLTVGELTRRIKGTLEETFGRVWVTGEISNYRPARSGHVYFTLKDRDAQIDVALFRGAARRVRFVLSDGLEVVVFGRLTVYQPRGRYQIVAERVEPKGLGALELAFRKLRERLQREGLFAAERKRPLPFLPRRVGIVTSPTGAAIKDILQVIGRRFPRADLLLAPVRVQGAGAAEEIARAIELVNRVPGVEVLIVGRGGGSLEDLWAFNEEVVARAIHASRLPVISAVGHEIDFTIADLVADRRALTPSEAAEIVLPRWSDLVERLEGLRHRLVRGLHRVLESARARSELAARRLAAQDPAGRVQLHQQRLDDLQQRAALAAARLIDRRRQRLAALAGKLDSLSPLAVLRRGYSITTLAGRVLTDAARAAPGATLQTRLARGSVTSIVERAQPDPEHPDE